MIVDADQVWLQSLPQLLRPWGFRATTLAEPEQFWTVLQMVNPDHFLMGYFDEFNPYFVVYALTKTVFFAFIISSISAWYGFHVKGGAVEVGKASTKAVVAMSFTIILFNYILTNVMLQ